MLAQPFADPGTPDLRAPWRFLWWLTARQGRTVAAGAGWGVGWMVSQAAVPAVLGRAVEAVVRHDRAGVVRWSLVLAALGVAQAVAGVMRHRRAVANFVIAGTRVAQLLSRAVSRLGPRLTDEVAAGEVANLGGADVERIGDLLDVTARLSGAVVTYVGVTVILLRVSVGLGAVVAGGAVAVAVVVGPLVGPLERRQTLERDRRAEASSLAADTVVGLRILRGLGGEVVFADRFGRASQAVRHAAVRTAQLQSYLDAGQVVLPQALVLAVTWIGAHLVADRHLDPGQLVAVYAYAAFLVLPVQTLVETSSKLTSARVAATRVLAVLRLDEAVPAQAPTTASAPAPTRPSPAEASPEPGPDGRGARSLVDPTTGLVATLGRMTAVASTTPEASAALVDRLGRWVEPPVGATVTLAGTPLGDLALGEIRRRVLVVDREAILLAGPLRELLDPPGRTGRISVEAALEAAAATDIVASLPDGLETVLPERARSLSGGQRQRILLAQALVADPEILVLDEPTSAVDAHTEAAIGERLAALRRGRTTVVCTTSPLVSVHADEVVFVDGVVVAAGSHGELLAHCEPYRRTVTRGADDGSPDDGGGP